MPVMMRKSSTRLKTVMATPGISNTRLHSWPIGGFYALRWSLKIPSYSCVNIPSKILELKVENYEGANVSSFPSLTKPLEASCSGENHVFRTGPLRLHLELTKMQTL